VLYDWDPLGICLSTKKPITLYYWYGAWRRKRAARRTKHKSVAMATVDAWRLAVGRVPPGGMEQQGGWKETGAWQRETGAPGGGDEWRLAAGRSPPGGDDVVMILQARGAWRCVMPAKRSGPVFAWRHEMRAKRFWFSDGA